jgi:hypothetical protein
MRVGSSAAQFKAIGSRHRKLKGRAPKITRIGVKAG